jgi:flagellar basal body-associated protein FliL
MAGTSLIDKILMVFNLIGVFSCLSVFVFQEFIYKRPIPKNEKEFSSFLEKESIPISGAPYKLDKTIINLPSGPRKLHYINVEVGLVPFLDHHTAVLAARKAILYDALIKETGKMRHNELSAMTGKIILEERLKKSMNEALGKAYIKKVLFMTYIVQ